MSPSRQSPPHGRSPAWAGTLTAVVIGVVALVALTYAVQVFLQAGEHEMELRAAVAAAEPLQTAGLAAALLLGVVASYVYKRASAAPDDRLDIVRTLREMVRSGRFWMAFVVSPIVFNVVLVAVGDADLTLTHYLLAFQNGFFWETVFARRGEPAGAEAT